MSITRIARQTKTPVTVVSAEAEGLDACGGACKWYTICDVHSECIGHETKALAISHASDPLGWCEQCMAAVAQK